MTRVLLLLLLLVSTPSAALAGEPAFAVMSFNIRCGFCESPDDVNHWSRRKSLVGDLIDRHDPDLIGLQEAVIDQARDLAGLLPRYDWIGVGREDGREQGEANIIMFKRSRFELLEHETLWLSPTPEVVGKGWDAAFNRTLTVARLRDRRSGRELWLLDTHFDHQGVQARVESARLIARLRASLDPQLPLVLVGDFNSTRESGAYPVLAGALRDSARIARSPPRGGEVSFNDFGKGREPAKLIDFIFVSDTVEVLSHRIVTKRYRGRYPSDHFPVLARLRVGTAP